ncbi:MAG: M28 family peptidase [Phycisphaerales bacterium]
MKLLLTLSALTLLTTQAFAQTQLNEAFKTLDADEKVYFQHVTTLSNPFFEGRAPGLHGNQLAAEYVEFNFKKLGLAPAFTAAANKADGDDDQAKAAPTSAYRQSFSTGRETVAKTQSFTYTANGKAATLIADRDFAVRGTSGNAKLDAPVVFVGYAIQDGKDGYASFGADDDLTGKAALVLRFEPLNDKGKSRWTADGAFSGKSGLASKLRAIADRHAAAIILVSPPGADDPRTNTIEDTKSSTGGTAMSVPIINLHVDAAAAMLAATGADLTALRKAADDKGGITEVTGLSVSIDAAVERRRNSTDNVAAVLAGKGSLKDDYIVIGAHYDHVGYGLFGSRTNETNKLHPGADDNASGTAGLLVIASKLAADYAKLPADANARSVMFVAFSGEEGGLIGSRHFVKNSPLEASRVYAMLNMDMIGRPRHDSKSRPKCEVSGVETAKGFMDILKPFFDDSGVAIKTLPGGQGPSDHASFYKANIPVLHFFTGLHDQYHTPRDTYDMIEPQGAVKIIELVRAVGTNLAQRTEPLEFTTAKGASVDYTEPNEEAPSPTAAAPAEHAAAPKPAPAKDNGPRRRARTQAPEPATPPANDEPATPSRSGMKVRFGIAPGDYDGGNGVLVGDVYPNTSAADAGLKTGDIITKWNDAALSSVQDWMPQLMRKPRRQGQAHRQTRHRNAHSRLHPQSPRRLIRSKTRQPRQTRRDCQGARCAPSHRNDPREPQKI